jgi:hypothetical protein
VAERGQVLFAGGNGQVFFPQPVEIQSDILGCNPNQFQTTIFRLRQKTLDRNPIRAAGVFVADAAEEKLFGGEHGGRASASNDLRQLAGEDGG